MSVLMKCPTDEPMFQTKTVPFSIARSCISGHVDHVDLHASPEVCTNSCLRVDGSRSGVSESIGSI